MNGADPHSESAPVALVTGAGRGIGAAIARLLSSQGWRLAVADRCADDAALPYSLASPAQLSAVAAEINAMPLEMDVREAEAVSAGVEAVAAQHGRLDAVICAAGAIAGGTSTWTTHPDVWNAMLDINLTGVFNSATAAMPHLLEAPAGRFVAIASAAGTTGLPQLAAYTAAKHGVVGLIRALAAEVGPLGVTANAVSPGSTQTSMLDATADLYGLDSTGDFAEHSRLQRLLEPVEIAAAVSWLCSPEASGVNGAVLAVDGGFSG